jgi:hypothetical protein
LTIIQATTPWLWSFDYDQRRTWIQQNPYVCMLPFNTHGIQVEFNNKLLPAKQKTYLKNTCCCNLIVDHVDDDVTNTPVNWFKDVQQTIRDGQPNTRCQRCYKLEAETGTSERTMSLMSASADQLEQFLTSGSVDVINFKIKFSNLCNLACRSCSPTFSSKYAQTHNLTMPAELSQDIGERSEVWDFVTATLTRYINSKSSVNLSLYGGESLIQPGAIKLLTWLAKNNLAPRVDLSITTNLTKINGDIIVMLDQFRSVDFAASIDSIGENYNYVRWPANFDQVQNNLASICQRIVGANVVLQPLWNLNNVFYINDYLDYWQAWFDRHNIHTIRIANVVMVNPFAFTIQNLPVEYRPALADQLQQAKRHSLLNDPRNESFRQWVDGMLDFANTDTVITDAHGQGFEQFLINTVKHDQANTTHMSTGNKKFYDLLLPEHRKLLHKLQNNSEVDQVKIYQLS